MAEGQEAAGGVGRQPPGQARAALVHERAALTLLAEPGVLQAGDHADGEVIGDPGHVDVLSAHPRHAERGIGRDFGRGELGQALQRVRVDVAVTLAVAQQPHRHVPPGGAHAVRGRHHDGTAALVDRAAVQQVQRIGDRPGRDHVLDGDVAPAAVHRQRVQGGSVPLRHRDLGQLLRGRAVFVEVPHGQGGVVGDPGGAVDVFIRPGQLGHGRDGRVAAGAGVSLAPARHGIADHDHLGQPVRDRVGGQVEPGRRRRRAHVAAGVEPDRVTEQFGHARGGHPVAQPDTVRPRPDEPVNVAEVQAGVGACAADRLPPDGGLRLLAQVPLLGLIDPGHGCIRQFSH